MSISFALGIPHTPWVRERAASLTRLLQGLGVAATFVDHVETSAFDVGVDVHMRRFQEKATNWVWSEAMWTWAVEQDHATHFLTLQDDVVCAPNFWAALRAMVEAHPDEIIGLQVAHPAARALAEEGHPWFTTADALVGVAYVVPIPLLREFLAWRATKLKPELVELAKAADRLPGGRPSPLSHEDTLLALWCVATGRRIGHPLPTIVDHDTELASTYGNDEHKNRRPQVTWTGVEDLVVLEREDFWRGDGRAPPHVGRFPGWSVPTLALDVVDGFTERDYARAMRDDGTPALLPIGMRRRARELEAAADGTLKGDRPLIFLATPTLGQQHPEHGKSIMLLAVTAEWGIEPPYELVETRSDPQDVVRVRSRLVRMFLESRCTHLLFLDDDVSIAPIVLAGMLQAKKDFVACPYPKRTGVDWETVKRIVHETPLHPEVGAYRYVVNLLPGKGLDVGADGCAEIAGVGLGCALITRACLERMVEEYGGTPQEPERVARYAFDRAMKRGPGPAFSEVDLAEIIAADRRHVARSLGWTDAPRGRDRAPTAALFQLLFRPGEHPDMRGARELCAEDISFCARWRAMGGKVWLYLGEGSPVDHHGEHSYRGHLEAFGLQRGS